MHTDASRILELLREAFLPDAPPFLPLVREDTFRDAEVEAVEAAFAGKNHWPSLDADFLNADGVASAPAFLSAEAISFFLPAYLSADLRDELTYMEPVVWLTEGFDGSYRSTHAKKGRATPNQEATRRWRLLTPRQCAAVAAYLRYRQQSDPFPEKIEAALQSFWMPRAAG